MCWLAGRYEDEEAAILFRRHKLAEATANADTLRFEVSKRPLKRKTTGDDLGRYTILVGLAEPTVCGGLRLHRLSHDGPDPQRQELTRRLVNCARALQTVPSPTSADWCDAVLEFRICP